MRMFTRLCAPLFLASLSGCIYLDRSEEYQQAGSIKRIEVPPGLKAAPIEPLYPIPEVEERSDSFYSVEADGFVVPRPEPMDVERESAKVKMQKVGDRQWVLLEAPAGQVWPLAQSFLSEAGVKVKKSVPATGLVETDWLQFKDDADTEHRYRLRIEQGVRPDTTEVHVLHQSAPEVTSSVETWPAQSQDSKREAWLLDGMANSLAQSIDNRAASLLGQSVGGEVKAKLFIDGSEPALRLRLSPERAWASLAHALSQEEFKLWGESKEQKVFYFQYLGPKQDRSRLKRWLSWADDADTKPTSSLEQLLANLADSTDARQLFADVPAAEFGGGEEEPAGFLLVVTDQGDSKVVKVRDARGQRLDSKLNKQLLAAIKRNLI